MKSYWSSALDTSNKKVNSSPSFKEISKEITQNQSSSNYPQLDSLNQIYSSTTKPNNELGQLDKSLLRSPPVKKLTGELENLRLSQDSYQSLKQYNSALISAHMTESQKLQADEGVDQDKIEANMKRHFKSEPIQSYFRIKATIYQLLPLVLKPKLKCLVGSNIGEAIPLELAESCDIVGKGELQRDGVTVQISDPKISEKHLSIKYLQNYDYEVLDLNSHSGTWIGLKAGEPQELVLNKVYEIGPYRFVFFRGPLINDVEEFLDMLDMVHLTDEFYSYGITKLSQLLSMTALMWEAFNLPVKEKKELQLEVQKYGKAFSSENFQDYRIIMRAGYVNKQQSFFVEFGLKGLKVGYNTLCDYKLEKLEKGRPEVEFEIQYMTGQYYLYIYPSIGKSSMIRKLEPDEKYILKPDEIILFGSMAFRYDIFDLSFISETGNRGINEDRYIIRQNFPISTSLQSSLFCVIDGHGGEECAMFLEKNLPIVMKRHFEGEMDNSYNLFESFNSIIRKVFAELDLDFHQKYPKQSMTCGATLCMVLVLGEMVFCVNVGDCRALVAKKNAICELTVDHKPTRPDERERIESLGGYVQSERLMGKVTISRCFGHFDYKKTHNEAPLNRFHQRINADLLTCEPEIKIYFLDFEDDFILLYTDGMLEGTTVEGMVNYIKEGFSTEGNKDGILILEEIIKNGKLTNSWNDNATCVLVKVPNNS